MPTVEDGEEGVQAMPGLSADHNVVMMSEEEYQASKRSNERIIAPEIRGARPPDKRHQKARQREDSVDVCPPSSSQVKLEDLKDSI